MTNQLLLTELAEKLNSFTSSEIRTLSRILAANYSQISQTLTFYLQQERLKQKVLIDSLTPAEREQVNEFLALTELDRELGQYWKTHWHTLKTEPEVIFNCQECNSPIKLSPADEKGRQVLEFYGKWTGQGHNLVCQKCLEKKETE